MHCVSIGVLLPGGACCVSGTVAAFPRDAPACCPDRRLDACGRCAAADPAAAAGRALGLDAAGECCVAADASGFLTKARRCCRSAALVDECGVCGGDGSSCERRIRGSLALAPDGRPARFTEILQARLPGVVFTSSDAGAAGRRRRLANAWGPSTPHSMRSVNLVDEVQADDPLPAQAGLLPSLGHAMPSASADASPRQHRHLLDAQQASQVAVEYRIMVDGGEGGSVVYAADQLAAAFVGASADAAAEGALTAASPLPAVLAQGVPGNGACELGETPGTSDGDCPAPLLCRTPARVGAPEPCGGNGACDPRSGACACARGYVGIDCGTCDAALGYEEQEVKGLDGGMLVLCSVVFEASSRTAAPGDADSGPPQAGTPDEVAAGGGGDASDWSWASLRWTAVVAGVTVVAMAMAMVWTMRRRLRLLVQAAPPGPRRPSGGRRRATLPYISRGSSSAGGQGSGRARSSAGGAAAGGAAAVVDGLEGEDDDSGVGGGEHVGRADGASVGAVAATQQKLRVWRVSKRTQVRPVGAGDTRDERLVFADDEHG